MREYKSIVPATQIYTVTPSDSVDLDPHARVLYVGTSGNVKVTTKGGTTAVIPNVPSGATLRVQVTRVWAAGTTASNIMSWV